jgi:hypothetical protein
MVQYTNGREKVHCIGCMMISESFYCGNASGLSLSTTSTSILLTHNKKSRTDNEDKRAGFREHVNCKGK